MIKTDARKLTATDQHLLRRKTVALARKGIPQMEIANELGISRSAISKYLRVWRDKGESALAPRPRGRPSGKIALSQTDEYTILDALCNHVPEEFGLAAKLWKNRTIQDFMHSKRLPLVTTATVSLWLREWEIRDARDDVEVIDEYDDEISSGALWYLQDYPRIKRLARNFKARILLFNERQWSNKFSTQDNLRYLLFAVDGRGTLFFKILPHCVTPAARIDFMERLMLDIDRPIVLLLDDHPNHKNRYIQQWQSQHSNNISLAYSQYPIYTVFQLNADLSRASDRKTLLLDLS